MVIKSFVEKPFFQYIEALNRAKYDNKHYGRFSFFQKTKTNSSIFGIQGKHIFFQKLNAKFAFNPGTKQQHAKKV